MVAGYILEVRGRSRSRPNSDYYLGFRTVDQSEFLKALDRAVKKTETQTRLSL